MIAHSSGVVDVLRIWTAHSQTSPKAIGGLYQRQGRQRRPPALIRSLDRLAPAAPAHAHLATSLVSHDALYEQGDEWGNAGRHAVLAGRDADVAEDRWHVDVARPGRRRDGAEERVEGRGKVRQRGVHDDAQVLVVFRQA